MKTLKKKALGFALLIQMLLYCAQSLLLTLLVPLGKKAMLGFSCFSAVAVFFLPVLIYCKLGGVTLGAVLKPKNENRRTRKPSKTVITFIFAVAMTVTVVNIFGFLTEAVTELFGKSAEGAAQSDPVMFVLIFVRNVLIASVFEELLFRGAVFDAFGGRSPRVRIAVSALLFALMHYSVGQFFYALAAGAVIAIFAYVTGSIIFAVCVHFAQNLTSFVFSVLASVMKESTFSTLSSVTFIAFLILALLGAVYTALLLKNDRIRDESAEGAESADKGAEATGKSAEKTANGAVFSETVAPVTDETENKPTVELWLYIALAAVLSVLNF